MSSPNKPVKGWGIPVFGPRCACRKPPQPPRPSPELTVANTSPTGERRTPPAQLHRELFTPLKGGVSTISCGCTSVPSTKEGSISEVLLRASRLPSRHPGRKNTSPNRLSYTDRGFVSDIGRRPGWPFRLDFRPDASGFVLRAPR